jgi:hypothetical protein
MTFPEHAVYNILPARSALDDQACRSSDHAAPIERCRIDLRGVKDLLRHLSLVNLHSNIPHANSPGFISEKGKLMAN